jgi:hypothetical protein
MKRKLPKVKIWGINLFLTSVEVTIQIDNKMYKYESRSPYIIHVMTEILSGYGSFTLRTLNKLKKYSELIEGPKLLAPGVSDL